MGTSTRKATYLRNVGLRINEERNAKGYKSQAAFAQAIETNPETVGRWERGQNEPGAYSLDLMASLGLDVAYVMTGKRSSASPALSSIHRDALSVRGLHWEAGDHQSEVGLSPLGLAWVLNYFDEIGEPLAWSVEGLAKLADYQPESFRDLNLQVVKLMPQPGKAYSHLLFYLRKTPPYTPWSISPSEGLKARYELDALSTSLPIVFPDNGNYLTPVLLIPDDMRDVLAQGHVVRVSNASVLVESPSLPPVQSGRQTSIVVHGDVGQQVSGNAVISGSQTFHVGSAKNRK